MSNNLTEITTTSWFSRIGSSLKGMVFGIILFLAAFPLLFMNEGRAVKTARALDEGAGAVIAVAADTVDPANEGQLVHLGGTAVTDETLTDTDFGVAANAILLERQVEMYQWRENRSTTTERKTGGSQQSETTYSYELAWSNSLINSNNFKQSQGYENPAAMPYTSQTVTAEKVTVGAFRLTPDLIGNLNQSQPLNVEKVPSGMADVQLFQGGFYLGQNPQSPQVGDVRITFRVVEPTAVTAVAQQAGDSFKPYQTSNGRTIYMLSAGSYGPEEMFETAQAGNRTFTWILRLAGIGMMFLGVMLLLRPLAVIADFLPFLGTLVGIGLGLAALLTALPLSFITIAIAWILYRPLLAIGLIVAGLLLVGAAVYAGKRSGNREASTNVQTQA
jgi:Transmembrane protein 43